MTSTKYGKSNPKKVEEEDAKKVLEKVAKQVQPIMKKRKWKVKVLSEFCPVNPALMGLNIGGGAEVNLRLRRTNNEDSISATLAWSLFMPIYLHSKSCYQLLQECEELMAKGITGTGQGFGLPGRRLGGFSRQPRPSALAAAENRARRDTLLPSGPKRPNTSCCAMAAERRLHDDLWCGSKSSDSVISIEGNVGRPEGSSTSVSSEGISAQTSPMTSMSGQESIGDHPTWQCNTCTLLNQPMALICEACGTQRHKDVAKFKVWFGKKNFCILRDHVGWYSIL
ncbi:hypothetical protein POPTR_010G249400v4 [Populus trichocarpa]|uniref:Uncharacterized protein n=1 Tax=Populus trichocarpa TaxID=3694 RepID=A0ACC0SFC6_POPTR|nr:hypothetical protein POPTR_010G249400v4 [Populus trichocarpa]